jgi:hypothetical protein
MRDSSSARFQWTKRALGNAHSKKTDQAMRFILLLILLLLVIGALPAWPYSTGWGYYPSGLGVVLLIVLLVVLLRR